MLSLMWYVLGLLTGLCVLAVLELNRHFDIDWKGWTGLGTGAFLVLFAIAWFGGALYEGEPQSASMGLIFFAGAGLIALVLTWRFLIEKSGKAETTAAEA